MTLTDLSSSPSARSTRGRTPVFRPTLNGEEFKVTVTRATFTLAEGQHDMAYLSCTSADLTTTDGMQGSLLTFLWGQAPRLEMFVGYILVAAVSQAGQGSFTFDIIVMGPTKPMQSGKPRYWFQRSYPGITQELAFANGLGFWSHEQPYVWESTAQTDDSDWALLNALADKTGWAVFNRYGVILYVDPARLFREQGAYCELRSSDDKDFQAADDRRLLEFSPQEASEDSPDSFGRQVAYFNDNGAVQVAKQTGVFKDYKFVTGFPIRNSEEAEILTHAGEIRMDEWKQRATARIYGDSDIYPGYCVDIVTTNRTYIRNKFDGRWLVYKVDHSMDTTNFQTNLSLVRPASNAPISVGSYSTFWSQTQRAKPTLMMDTDKWRSSWASSAYGAIA